MLKQTIRTLLALVALTSLVGCPTFEVDGQTYICRNEAECGEGFNCRRGPGCYCICKPEGAAVDDFEMTCEDPTCLSVQTAGKPGIDGPQPDAR